MLMSYITLGRDHIFRVLPNRDDGYSPLYQSTSLEDVEQLEPTSDGDKVCAIATAQPDTVDVALRELASLFLEDIDSLILDDSLYSHGMDTKRGKVSDEVGRGRAVVSPAGQTGVTWPPLAAFYRTSATPLPARFDDIEEALKTTIRLENRRGALFPGTEDLDPDDDDGVEVSDTELPGDITQREEVVEVVTEDVLSQLDQPSDSLHSSDMQRGSSSKCPPSCTCPEAVEAEKVIMKAMSGQIRLHYCPFQRFNEAEDFAEIGQTLSGEVQLVLTDPPFNYRRERGEDNAWYDALSSDDMEQVGDLMADLLRPGGHGVIFTSPLQFSM